MQQAQGKEQKHHEKKTEARQPRQATTPKNKLP
jgi:hypothetical protein